MSTETVMQLVLIAFGLLNIGQFSRSVYLRTLLQGHETKTFQAVSQRDEAEKKVNVAAVQIIEAERKISDISQQLNEALLVSGKETTKLEASLSANGAFETSRDQVWDMYRRSSLAAGSAQSWLFRELNTTIQLLNRYRSEKGEEPMSAPPGLEDVLEEFQDEHVDSTKANKP